MSNRVYIHCTAIARHAHCRSPRDLQLFTGLEAHNKGVTNGWKIASVDGDDVRPVQAPDRLRLAISNGQAFVVQFELPITRGLSDSGSKTDQWMPVSP